MGNGQWAMGNGQWAMGNGHWALVIVSLVPLVSLSPCPMPHAPCPMPYAPLSLNPY
ncbi:MAG: hypothetical protein KME31_23270 [Tolypothrix carrinoi HA7290-LM1]|nr:hypothetical protein [Tolypothrix carrinoi HA7290-LM1]